MEKQVKELNVRIVDLETRSYANSPRPATISRRVDGRIEELTNQLNQNNRDRNALGRSAEKLAKDVKFQQSELERQRAKFEEEKKEYEARIQDLRNALDMVVCLYVFGCFRNMMSYLCLDSKRKNTSYKQLTVGQHERLLIINNGILSKSAICRFLQDVEKLS